MKTNSNSYTIIYSAVIVVIVAFLLAFVFQGLKPQQDANVALDKKKQILNALNIRDLSNEVADKTYNAGKPGGEQAGFKLESKDYKAGRLALYVCKVNGQRKYVIPVYGMGLWGPISGYIALNEDKATVYGVYFNHESETAGLGAEIKDNAAWQAKFQGKKLFAGGNDKAIALGVEKKVDDPATQVDAVTGATLTSNGVRDMLHEGLSKYLVFLNEHSSNQ